MHSRKFRKFAAAVVVTMGVVTTSAGTAVAANSGSASSAKLCQKGGWQDLRRDDQTSTFANLQDCVSYAAQGGTLTLPCYDSSCL